MGGELRQMGKIRQIVEEATGLEITHVHDDLIFVEHSAILLQFDDADFGNFLVHFNPECDPGSQASLMQAIQAAALNNGMRCSEKGKFKFNQVPDKDELRIEFW